MLLPPRKFSTVLFLLVFVAVAPLRAESPTEFPTVSALNEAVVPPSNVVDLARRFRGVQDVPPPPLSVPLRQVGEQQQFWVSNADTNEEFQIPATLRTIGEHIYLWVQDGAPLGDKDLQALATAFDTQIYPNVRALWGSENMPGVDGDPRIYGLFAYSLGNGLAAYFTSRSTYPVAVWPTSNQHEMFFFNLDAIDPSDVASFGVESTIAHEFQHMIRANIQANDDLWLNEGFSSFTQVILYGDIGAIPSYLNNPQTQLNTWAETGPRAPHYGAADLFVTYFYERFGLAALQQLSHDPGKGLDAFDNVLRSLGEADVNDLFADWVLANILLDPTLADGRYGYRLLQNIGGPRPVDFASSYPYSYQGILNQYGVDYHTLTVLDGLKSLDISVDVPDTVKLVPADAASGHWMWYSNKGDLSDITLTRDFDLRTATDATLSYKAWYDIEDFYDYAYVTVSTDAGATWDILSTPRMDTTDPLNSAYGPGYTGESNGWVDEQIALIDYVGKDILLRFELITDDGVTRPGLALDDIHLDAAGYQDDFEADGGGWEAAGWVRTDNRLPQQMWVQAVQKIGSDVNVSRWLVPVESHWTLPLEDGASEILMAIAPFAPVTTEPVIYTLRVTTGAK
ncbi:MAG: immune inhibitor A [Anaerolineae bacterium]